MHSSLKKAISELQHKLKYVYGKRLDKILLYGSHARGDAGLDSDIDVLVVLDGLVHPGEEMTRMSPHTAEISLKYDTVLSCYSISKERFLHENSPFILNVHREGVLI